MTKITKFPEDLDTNIELPDIDSDDLMDDVGIEHDVQHTLLNQAVIELQKKVGKNNSEDVDSLQFKANMFDSIIKNSLPEGSILKGKVDLYENLPDDGLDEGDAYFCDEDGLIYVWDGEEFPDDGDGILLSMGGGEVINLPRKAWRLLITDYYSSSYISVYKVMFSSQPNTHSWLGINDGVPFSDSIHSSGYSAEKAFDYIFNRTSTSDTWASSTDKGNHFIGIISFIPTIVSSVTIRNRNSSTYDEKGIKSFEVQFSNDTTNGSNGSWTTVAAFENLPIWEKGEFRTFYIS